MGSQKIFSDGIEHYLDSKCNVWIAIQITAFNTNINLTIKSGIDITIQRHIKIIRALLRGKSNQIYIYICLIVTFSPGASLHNIKQVSIFTNIFFINSISLCTFVFEQIIKARCRFIKKEMVGMLCFSFSERVLEDFRLSLSWSMQKVS